MKRLLFNRNMGCIEILLLRICRNVISVFNRNMGCIEMSSTFPPTRINGKFNRNMGCIEIKHVHTGDSGTERLIETWDVLKSLSFLHSLSIDNKFNRNMGCIEI